MPPTKNISDPDADERYAPHTPGDRDSIAAGKASSPTSEGGDPETTGAGDWTDPRGDLSKAEKSGGLYNSGQGVGSDRLGSESTEDDTEPASFGKNPQKKRRFNITKKKAGIFAVIAGLSGGGILGFFSIVQGPAQLIHLSEILSKPASSSRIQSAQRLGGLYRWAKTGSYGETRVGVLGSNRFAKYTAQLKEIGVEFHSNVIDHITSVSIEPEKLSNKYPELKGMSEGETRSWVSEKLGVSGDLITFEGGKATVNSTDLNWRATKLLKNNTTALLEDGRIAFFIKNRVIGKFYDVPGITRPISAAVNDQQDKAIEKAKGKLSPEDTAKVEATQVAAEPERIGNELKPVEAKALPATTSLKEKIKSPGALAGSALLVTGGMCLVRSAADDIVEVNRAAMVAPGIVQAADKIAVGSQLKSGTMNLAIAGGISKTLKDENGKSVWASKALQAEAGAKNPAGEDIPKEYSQAFSKDTTAASIKDTIGGGVVGGIACSPIGQGVQLVAGFALLIGSLAAAPETGGASIGVAEAGKTAVGVAATAGAVAFLEKLAVNLFSDKTVFPDVMSGPLGGSLLALSSREMANTTDRSTGGVALSDTDETTLALQDESQSQHDFQSKSFFARMFDTNDYRSMSGRLADSLSPSVSNNIASAATSFINMGGGVAHSFSALIPKAHATPSKYHWPMPRFGIPLEVINDPNLANPYVNGDEVAHTLDSSAGQDYVDKAAICFGVSINKDSGVWDVKLGDDAVNPNSDNYTDAHCDDLDDYTWRRVILFVFDTNTMKAADCFDGNDQSCEELGYPQTASSTGSSASQAGTLPTGDSKQLATQLLPLVKKGNIQCNFSPGCPDIINTASGQSIKGGEGCLVDALQPALLGMLLELSKMGHTFVLSALCSDHHNDGLTEHSGGNAADFNTIDDVFMGPDDVPWNSEKLAVGKKLDEDAASFLAKGSSAFGQTQCHPEFSFLSGFTTYEDACHHQHIRAGAK